MTYESDAADAQLFEDGKIAVLLAKYDDAIVGRCVARLRGHPDAEDVAQDVKLRLLAEFRRGKRYGETPYRVVVHQVIGWTIADYFGGRRTDVPLPDDWNAAGPDESDAVISHYYLEELIAPLPERSRRVLELRYLKGVEISEIGRELDIRRNAVDQALHRGHKALREAFLADG